MTSFMQRAARAYRRGGATELINVGRRRAAQAIAPPEASRRTRPNAPFRSQNRELQAAVTSASNVEQPIEWSDDAKTIPMNAPYQVKLAASLEERCAQVDRSLGRVAGSVLDIGCNLGDITAHCASKGRFSVGIDNSPALIQQARRRHKPVTGCGFVVMDLTPDRIASLPTFDAMLLLSVHHHWLGSLGPDMAGQMLRDLAARTRRVMVFESASRRARYGKYPPDIVDNDEHSVTSYLRGYLEANVGDLFDRIEPLGKTPCVGAREPYRWAFALHR